MFICYENANSTDSEEKMEIRTLQQKKVADLREIAKVMGFEGISKLKKDELIDLIINGNSSISNESDPAQEIPFVYDDDDFDDEEESQDDEEDENDDESDDIESDAIDKGTSGGGVDGGSENPETVNTVLNDKISEKTGSERENTRRKNEQAVQEVEGVLEIMEQGYGFLRFENFLSSEQDVYVSNSQIRKFSMRTGDKILGSTRAPNAGERFKALLFVKSINGMRPQSGVRRPRFDDLTPLYPNERFRLTGDHKDHAMRIIDIVSPIGKGQRGLIVAPPKSGKTILLQKIAKSISKNYPDVELIVLLIDERPEEVTDMKRSIDADVIYSTFDELPSHHVKVAEMVLHRAKALVEQRKDVVILLDSITRLARAYNLVMPSSGKTLSGGLDPSALHRPKRFFGAARNVQEGGSLTILATALVETGSRMDDVIFEEFKGTGNMELLLDRKLSEKRIFPSIDIRKSGTRREELILNSEELEAIWKIRRNLDRYNNSEIIEKFIDTLLSTKDNETFFKIINKD